MADNFTRYKTALKAEYERKKTTYYESNLAYPTWAGLRKLCVQRYVNNDNETDATIFKRFFGFNFAESTKEMMKGTTNRFRPLVTFLRNETDLQEVEAADLIAVLINFERRPFAKFIGQKDEDYNVPDVTIGDAITEEIQQTLSEGMVSGIEPDYIPHSNNNRKKIILSLLCIIVILGGYITATIMFPEKKFMQWQTDHYVALKDNQQATLKPGFGEVRPIDNTEIEKRALRLDSISCFFRNRKPVVWYIKEGSKLEFFNRPGDGTHPLSGKPLKAITTYIIRQYQLDKKSRIAAAQSR